MAQNERRAITQSAGSLTPPPRGPKVATQAASFGAPRNGRQGMAWPQESRLWLRVLDAIIRPPTLALFRAVAGLARRLHAATAV